MEELDRILEEWNCVYDYVMPQQSLGYLIPMEFLGQWMEESKRKGLASTMS